MASCSLLIGPAQTLDPRTLGVRRQDAKTSDPRTAPKICHQGKCPEREVPQSFTAYYTLHYNLALTGFSVLTASLSLFLSFFLSLLLSFQKKLLRPELEREKSLKALAFCHCSV